MYTVYIYIYRCIWIYIYIYLFVYYIIDRGFREICRKLSVNSHKALVLRSTTHLGEDWGDLDCYVSYSTLPDMLVFQADKILNKQETAANWQRPKRAYSNYGSVRQTYHKAQTAAFCCTAAQEFCCQGTCLGWRQMSDRRPGCSEFCHFGPLSMMAWHTLESDIVYLIVKQQCQWSMQNGQDSLLKGTPQNARMWQKPRSAGTLICSLCFQHLSTLIIFLSPTA